MAFTTNYADYIRRVHELDHIWKLPPANAQCQPKAPQPTTPHDPKTSCRPSPRPRNTQGTRP